MSAAGGHVRAVSRTPGARLRDRGAPWGERMRAIPWRFAPGALALVYVTILLVRLGAFLAGLAENADNVAPWYLASQMGGHDGIVWLGNSAWYSTLWFDIATRALPFHRELWQLAPLAAAAVTVAAVGWSTARVAGRWAAGVAVALLICSGAAMADQLAMLNDHLLTWLSASALFAGLVWILDSPPAHRRRWVARVAPLWPLLAFNLASDPLLYCAGIIPVLVAAALVHHRAPSERTREGVVYAACSTLVAVAGSRVAIAVMDHARILVAPHASLAAVSITAIPEHLVLWIRSLAVLAGAPPALIASGPAAIAGWAAAAVTLAAAILFGASVAPKLRRVEGRAGTATVPALEAHVVCWASSAAVVSAAFVLSDAVGGIASARYLVGAVIAMAALVPLLGRSGRIVRLITIGACIHCAAGLAFVSSVAAPTDGITPRVAAEVLRLARIEHASHGFASYWDARSASTRMRAHPGGICHGGGSEASSSPTAARTPCFRGTVPRSGGRSPRSG
jgi:hypothetical protein